MTLNTPNLPDSLPRPKLSYSDFHIRTIERLHDIVMGELFVHQGFEHYEQLLRDIIDLCANINMQGALSHDALDTYRKVYNNEVSRRFFGTIAMNMEYYLKATWKDYDPVTEFTRRVVSSIMLDASAFSPPSEIEPALGSVRIESDQAHGFNNPVDFWFICFIAFRMTVGETQVYPYLRQQLQLLIDDEKPGRPVPEKKTTFRGNS